MRGSPWTAAASPRSVAVRSRSTGTNSACSNRSRASCACSRAACSPPASAISVNRLYSAARKVATTGCPGPARASNDTSRARVSPSGPRKRSRSSSHSTQLAWSRVAARAAGTAARSSGQISARSGMTARRASTAVRDLPAAESPSSTTKPTGPESPAQALVHLTRHVFRYPTRTAPDRRVHAEQRQIRHVADLRRPPVPAAQAAVAKRHPLGGPALLAARVAGRRERRQRGGDGACGDRERPRHLERGENGRAGQHQRQRDRPPDRRDRAKQPHGPDRTDAGLRYAGR